MKNLGVTVLSVLILAGILIGTWQYRQLQSALVEQQQPSVVYQSIQAPLSPWLSGEFSLLGSKTPPGAYNCVNNFVFNEKLCGYAATVKEAKARLEFREHLHHQITGPAQSP